MRILQLVNRIPFPLNDGGNLAVHACMDGFLNAGVSLSMLAMNTSRHYVEQSALPEIFKRLDFFATVAVDNRIKPVPAFLNLFGKKSYNISRFVTRDFETALIEVLKSKPFDIVLLEGLFLVPYVDVIRKYSTAKIVIRQHNVEYRIWERLASQTKNILKRSYLKLLARRLKAFELENINKYDLILPISESDGALLKKLGTNVPVFYFPFTIDLTNSNFCPIVTDPVSLYHIAAMDWQPNVESVDWLLNEVYPILDQRLGNRFCLYLAGRNMPAAYKQKERYNIVVAGEVEDAERFEQDKSVLLVPLQSGGGVRIKIFKGMAMGKAIVTTGVGVEGIEARDNEEVLVADSAMEFAEKVISLVNQPQKILDLGKAARNLIESKYDRQSVTAELLSRFRDLLRH